MADSATARPSHKVHRHHVRATAAADTPRQIDASGSESIYSFMRSDWEMTHHKQARARASRHGRYRTAYASAAPFAGGFTTNALVAEARKYIGTNPTGWRSLWCGHFLAMVLKRTGHPGGGTLASAYAHYGHRVGGPRVGAIAVMWRRGGGHVGIVTGIDENGNPIIVSGNFNNKVEEVAYPRRRIYAYVMPD
jgi:uncharacterized protein (TIGR02594 family)